jgi:lipopolysaccharide export system permease protein
MKAIDRYLLSQIMPTLLVTLFIAAVILSMDRLMRLLDIAVGNGVSTLVVFQMLFNLVPQYIALALPVGLFLGVLLAFRKLSMQAELDAINASGIGISRLIRPAIGLAFIMMALNFAMSGYIQPYTRYAYRAILFKVTSGVIEQGIGEGIFMNLPNGYTLRVDQSRSGGRELYGVFAHRQEPDGRIITLTAKQGELVTGGLDGNVSLRLLNGNRTEWDPVTKATSTLQFEMNNWELNLSDLMRFRGRGGDEHELTIAELMRGYRYNLLSGRFGAQATANPEPEEPPEQIVAPSAVAAEFHNRLIFGISMLFLPLLAAPMGIMTRRSSRSFGLILGLSLIVSYQKCLDFTTAYGSATGAPAGVILWSMFGLFAIGSTYLFYRTDLKAGTPPVQQFEAGWIAFKDRIVAVFRRKPASASGARAS